MNTANVTSSINTRVLPGDFAMWVLILAELSVFALMFFTYAVARYLNPEVFLTGQSQLDRGIGLLITLALLTASYFVAQASRFFPHSPRRCQVWLLAGSACGGLYVAVKLWEYQRLAEVGHGLSGDLFFTLYFFITGFHLLHVLLGIGILWVMAFHVGRKQLSPNALHSGASYWHMVDLVWLVLFPLLYLIR